MKYHVGWCLIISLVTVVNSFVASDLIKNSRQRPISTPTPPTTTTSLQMKTATTLADKMERESEILTPIKRRKLPDGKLIVGYANWNQCDDKILEAVQHGVNVVIWFSINLRVNERGQPTVENGPDMACVASMVQRIRKMGLECVHLISIGGWNSLHPDTTNSAEVVFRHWHEWNTVTISDPTKGFFGFDGFDWYD